MLFGTTCEYGVANRAFTIGQSLKFCGSGTAQQPQGKPRRIPEEALGVDVLTDAGNKGGDDHPQR